MYVSKRFPYIHRGVEPSGSVFTKIATADAKRVEAKGRIIAIDAANAAAHKHAAGLEDEVSRVHQESDLVHDRYDEILNSL